MLDIRYIRENAESIATRLLSRGTNYSDTINSILECDTKRRAAETRQQELNAERKSTSKQIGILKSKGEDTSAIEQQVKGLGVELNKLAEEVTGLNEEQRNLLLGLPNLPHPDCPPGNDAASNPVIRSWGDKPELAASPANHLEIGEQLGLFDPELATKISGSGYMLFTGDGARLQRALIQFMLDLHTRNHGYHEVSPPFLIRRDCMVGTGQLPKFEDDMYGIDEGTMFLAPTAEVPVTNLAREEILNETDLPRNLVAYTPCFRREAGAAGRESRGMIRLHQFDKVELVKLVKPENSYKELEALTANAEAVLQALGLHYRVIELCTGDLGFSAAKTYDIEVWSPGQNDFLEVSSCSNFEDYQARRMNLRFKDSASGKNVFCHTLNGSGTALPRLFIALIETYFQQDGTISLPQPLHTYFGAETISAR